MRVLGLKKISVPFDLCLFGLYMHLHPGPDSSDIFSSCLECNFFPRTDISLLLTFFRIQGQSCAAGCCFRVIRCSSAFSQRSGQGHASTSWLSE